MVERNPKLVMGIALIVIAIAGWLIFSPGLFDQLKELEGGRPLPTSTVRPPPSP